MSAYGAKELVEKPTKQSMSASKVPAQASLVFREGCRSGGLFL